MSAPGSLEEVLIRLEKGLLDARIRKSEEVSRWLAPDFMEFGSSGQVFHREEVVLALRTEAPVSFEASDFVVRLLSDDVALLTYRAVRVGNPASRSLRSSVWKQNGGLWQMVFHHGTGLAE